MSHYHENPRGGVSSCTDGVAMTIKQSKSKCHGFQPCYANWGHSKSRNKYYRQNRKLVKIANWWETDQLAI